MNVPPTAAEMRATREYLNLPAPVFADLLGVSLRQLRRYEGEHEVPTKKKGLLRELSLQASDKVAELVERYRDVVDATMIVGREDYWEGPGSDMPAGWWRAVALRVKEKLPHVRIVFAESPKPIRDPKPVDTPHDPTPVMSWTEAMGPSTMEVSTAPEVSFGELMSAYTDEVSELLPDGLRLTADGLVGEGWSGSPEEAKEALKAAVGAVDTETTWHRVRASKPRPEACPVRSGVWMVRTPSVDVGMVLAGGPDDMPYRLVDAEHAWMRPEDAPIIGYAHTLEDAVARLSGPQEA